MNRNDKPNTGELCHGNLPGRIFQSRKRRILILNQSLIPDIRGSGPYKGEASEAKNPGLYLLIFLFMYLIKNIGEEPFAIAGCPLLQKGETAEVTAYTMNMVRFNPNIEIVSGGLK